jgi:GT2 family glycosyltransferase
MLAVVIPSKHADIFSACYENLNKYTSGVRKILVRDGNEISTPQHPDWLCLQGSPEGFVYARNVNLGVSEALKDPAVDAVMLVNDDVKLTHETTLRCMHEVLQSNPSVGILSPAIEGYACNPEQAYPQAELQVVDNMFVTFVCVLITRKVFEKIGFLDERFVGYGSDDVDFCRRAKSEGFKLAVTSSSIVKHGHGTGECSSSYKRLPNQDVLAEVNRRAYTKKWGRGTDGNFLENQVLIAIRSCVRDAVRGDNQAVRDTWAKDVRLYNYEYRFFIGDGTPVDDSAITKTSEYGSCYVGRRQESITEMVPKIDEEIVPCPDDYFHMPYKLREICRYALREGYDYVFTPCDDVYVDVYRLSTSEFKGHDYIGNLWNGNPYAHGGPGFWLSKKACEIIANAPVTSTHDDEWVGMVLAEHGIFGHHDTRYAYDSDVLQDDTVAMHMTFLPGTYKPEWMRITAEKWPVDLNTIPVREGAVPVTIMPECTPRERKAAPRPILRIGPIVRRPDGRVQRRYTK